MDSLGLGRGSDTAGSMRTQSPPRTSQNTRQAQEHGQVRQDSELLSPGIARVTDVPFTEEVHVEPKDRSDATPGTSGRDDDETIMPRSGRSGLPTVAERKSEYGIEGLIASYEARGDTSSGTSQPDASPLATTAESGTVPASHEGVPAISSATARLTPKREIAQDKVDQVTQARELQELDQTEGVTRDETLRSRHSPDKVGKGPQEDTQLGDLEKVQSGEELRRLSTSPKLPELGRLSVFGLDLFSSSASSDPSNSSSFNLPTSSPPPPVPHIPSSHTMVSPSSPLSTVIESPSSSSTLPQQDARLGEARQGQGQASGDGNWTEVGSRPGTSSPEDTVPVRNDASPGSAPPVHVSQHASRGEPGSSAEHHISDAAPNATQSRPSSAGEGQAADSPKGSQSGAPTLPVLHAGSDPVTSKSESEQLPGVGKALPALPSEVSVVTPDPQASQLAISAPVPIGSSEQDSNALSTGNTKLAVHPPLLRENSEQAKGLVSQVLPSPTIPGPLMTDYPSNVLSTDSENPTQSSFHPTSSQFPGDGGLERTVPEEQLSRGSIVDKDTTSDEATLCPPQPANAPPPIPGEMSRGETYVTAVESPSSDRASPTKSDKLSAEILQSLSPATPTATTATESAGPANLSIDGPSSGGRESSFLPDLYDDYWNFAGSGNAAEANATPAIPTNTVSDAMPAALNVQSGETRPRSLVGVKDDNIRSGTPSSAAAATPRSSVDVFKTDVQAVTVELHRPVLPNRFSWERDGIEAAKIDIQVEPKTLTDKPQTSTAVSTSSSEPAPLRSMLDVKSADPISESTETSSAAPDYENKGKGVAQSRSPSPPAATRPSSGITPSTLGNPSDHPGPLNSHPVMTLREILQFPFPGDRIGEINNTRAHYATTDTGLEPILEDLADKHPDIVEASRAGGPSSRIYTYELPSLQDVGGLLSRTTPGATAAPTRHHSHPTGHIRPKTKEFLKASKGLFSNLKAKGKKVAN